MKNIYRLETFLQKISSAERKAQNDAKQIAGKPQDDVCLARLWNFCVTLSNLSQHRNDQRVSWFLFDI